MEKQRNCLAENTVSKHKQKNISNPQAEVAVSGWEKPAQVTQPHETQTLFVFMEGEAILEHYSCIYSKLRVLCFLLLWTSRPSLKVTGALEKIRIRLKVKIICTSKSQLIAFSIEESKG